MISSSGLSFTTRVRTERVERDILSNKFALGEFHAQILKKFARPCVTKSYEKDSARQRLCLTRSHCRYLYEATLDSRRSIECSQKKMCVNRNFSRPHFFCTTFNHLFNRVGSIFVRCLSLWRHGCAPCTFCVTLRRNPSHPPRIGVGFS